MLARPRRSKPARGQRQTDAAPCQLLTSPPHCRFGLFGRLAETHTTAALFKTQIPPHPQSKPGQANPSPAKPIQIKLLGFAWFYSSESGLIKGLQRIPNTNFSPGNSPCRQARLARRAFVF